MPIIKEKKQSGLVFSLCKMSVVVGVTAGRTAVAVFLMHTQRRGQAAGSPCWSASAKWGQPPAASVL